LQERPCLLPTGTAMIDWFIALIAGVSMSVAYCNDWLIYCIDCRSVHVCCLLQWLIDLLYWLQECPCLLPTAMIDWFIVLIAGASMSVAYCDKSLANIWHVFKQWFIALWFRLQERPCLLPTAVHRWPAFHMCSSKVIMNVFTNNNFCTNLII
jgi:hypothetical protein